MNEKSSKSTKPLGKLLEDVIYVHSLDFSMFEKDDKRSYFQNKRGLFKYLKSNGARRLSDELEVRSLDKYFSQGNLLGEFDKDKWVFIKAYPAGVKLPRYERGPLLELLDRSCPNMSREVTKMVEGDLLSKAFGFAAVSPVYKSNGLKIREFFENFGITINSIGASFVNGFFDIENNETVQDIIKKYNAIYLDSIIMCIDRF